MVSGDEGKARRTLIIDLLARHFRALRWAVQIGDNKSQRQVITPPNVSRHVRNLHLAPGQTRNK